MRHWTLHSLFLLLFTATVAIAQPVVTSVYEYEYSSFYEPFE